MFLGTRLFSRFVLSVSLRSRLFGFRTVRTRKRHRTCRVTMGQLTIKALQPHQSKAVQNENEVIETTDCVIRYCTSIQPHLTALNILSFYGFYCIFHFVTLINDQQTELDKSLKSSLIYLDFT